jgi:hypothetical protein
MPDNLNILERAKLTRRLQINKRRIDKLEELLSGVPVGTAKFQDLAITNAKIEGLSADKITAGTLSVQVDVGDPTSGYVRFDAENDRIIINDGTTNRVLISPDTVRVSLPGINALETSPDPTDYALLADEDNVLIKEQSRGSVEVSDADTEVVAHNLNYLPHFYAYGEVSSGRFQIATGFNLFGDFVANVDDTNLNLNNRSGSTAEMRYFIFYDDIPE